MSSNNYKYTRITRNTDLRETILWQNSFWQSPLWAEILRETHQAKDIIVCTTPDNRSILLERRSIVGKYCGLFVLGVDESLVTPDFLDSVKKKIVDKHDLFLQIEPLSEDVERSTLNVKRCRAPFRRFIEPQTALIQLKDQTQELLLQSFAEKGRYNIRLAQKRGVTTKWVKANEKMNNVQCTMTDWLKNPPLHIEHWTLNIEKTYIEAFFDLLNETTQRDGFAHNPLAYYAHFVETLEAHEAGGLLVAEKDGLLHAAGVFAYYDHTGIYYYGASSSDSVLRRDMATYLLQWEAICEARRRGCNLYDFLWISADRKWKLAGVTEFKLRFNPEKKEWPKEHVIIYRPLVLKVLQWASRIRKVLR